MQIKIAIPEEHTSELKYIVDLLFGDLLRVDYITETRIAIKDVVVFVGEKKLIFQDHFFSNLLEDDFYVNEKYFPPKVRFLENGDDLVPIIYGHDYFYRDDKMTVCGLDIYSSLFFLLTAWEEDARKYIFEKYHYFPFNASWIWKNGLHERDVLKEYAELLVTLLEEIGFDTSCIKLEFPKPTIFVIVEDIQYFKDDFKAPTLSDYLSNPLKSIKENKKWKEYKEKKKDPWNNLQHWVDYGRVQKCELCFLISEALPEAQIAKVKNFVERKQLKLGAYLSFSEKIIDFSEYSPIVIESAKESLQKKWRLLNDSDIKYSINAYFGTFEGNRCGVSVPFRTYDIFQRKVLDVIEIPVISCNYFDESDPDNNHDKDFILANATQHSVLISNLLFNND